MRRSRRRPADRSADVVAVRRQGDVNVAPSGVGIGAHLVRSGDNPRCLVRIGNLRQRDIEPDGDCERPVICGDKADRAVDRRVTYLHALAATHDAQRTFEARRIAYGEELLRVGSAAFTAHLFRRPELNVQDSVIRAPVSLDAAPGRRKRWAVKAAEPTLSNSSP